jgi:hypothetical protein
MKRQINPTHKTGLLEILKAFEHYRFLTLNQMRALFKSRILSGVKEIINKLWKHNFLERLILTRAAKKISLCYVFALSRNGAHQITAASGKENIFYLKANDKRSSLFIEHTLLINNFRICLEILSQGKSNFRLIIWTQSKQDIKVHFNAY